MISTRVHVNDLAPIIPLDGAWDFTLGDSEQWSEIQVPGAWEAQGYDRRIEGPAHYRRWEAVPDEWAGSRIVLDFGAVSYACRVAVNGSWVEEHHGMWTPFSVDITAAVHPGQSNLIEVEVFKPSHLPGARFPFRASLAGFIPDLGTTFGGLWQEASLRALRAWFEDWRLQADLDTEEVICSFRTNAVSTIDLDAAVIDLSVSLAGRKAASCTVEHKPSGGGEARCKVPHPALWSLENPVLYDVQLTMCLGDQVLAKAHRRIGFRRLSTSGETLLFNDRPIVLRGILNWGWDPDHIAPSYRAEAAHQEIRQLKHLGFNLIKLCLFVPNPAYYDAADEEGVFLWQEWPMWLPKVDPDYAARAPGEYAEYMALTRHHPSVVLYSAGCELDETVGTELLGSLNSVMRTGTSGALFCDNSGMGEAYGGLQIDFADFSDYHTYSELNFFEEMLDHWRRDWKPPRPLIFGEFCDSDTFRILDEVRAHCGGQAPWWMLTANPLMDWRPEARSILDQTERLESMRLDLTPQRLKEISYDSSLAIRKFILESVRKRAGIGGYVITAQRDTPITTTGIFDDFGSLKWRPEQFLPFNGEFVLCLDGDRHRRWQYGGDRMERVDLQNVWGGERVRRRLIFSGPGVVFQGKAQLNWRLIDAAGEVVAAENQQVWVDLEGTRPREIAAISFQMPPVNSTQENRLEAEFYIPPAQVKNTWSLWSYQKHEHQNIEQASAPVLYDPGFLLSEYEKIFSLKRPEHGLPPGESGLVIASALPDWSEDFLKAGGGMILLQWGDGPLPALRRPFWREAIRIFTPHPVWDRFGPGGDVRFLGLSSDVSLDLARLDKALPALDEARPIFRRLDGRDFRISEYMLEARLGRGLLLACSLRLSGGYGRQPSGLVRNVAGQGLFWAMLDFIKEKVR